MSRKSSVTVKRVRILLAIIIAFVQMTDWGMGGDKITSSTGGASLPQRKQISARQADDAGSWNINAKIIEACSCRLMCPCYFNTSPDKHFCQFNNAFKVLSGHYGGVDITDVKFWVS